MSELKQNKNFVNRSDTAKERWPFYSLSAQITQDIKLKEFFHSEVQINVPKYRVFDEIHFGKKFQQFHLVDLFGQLCYHSK